MENASKALIIAGAILLSILIIAIGMYIYNSSQNSIATAGSQISAQDIQSFNTQWEMYEGEQTGANVKSLILKLIANAKTNETEASRLVNLYCEFKSGSKAGSRVKPTTADLNINGFNNIRTQIQPRHTYYVTLVQSEKTSLVHGVIITYDKEDVAGTYSIYNTWAAE